jgi:hypothetical protein
MGLTLVSFTSFVAALETGHWFAAPFALLFFVGYSGVAWLVASEQLVPRPTPELVQDRQSGETGVADRVGTVQRAA